MEAPSRDVRPRSRGRRIGIHQPIAPISPERAARWPCQDLRLRLSQAQTLQVIHGAARRNVLDEVHHDHKPVLGHEVHLVFAARVDSSEDARPQGDLFGGRHQTTH